MTKDRLITDDLNLEIACRREIMRWFRRCVEIRLYRFEKSAMQFLHVLWVQSCD